MWVRGPNQTQYSTNSADPTPMTVSGGFPSPKPDTDESDDRFEHKKPIPNWSDCIYTGKVVILHRWVRFASVLVRLVEIRAYLFEIHRDLVEIRPDLFEIRWDLFEIQLDHDIFGPISTKFDGFRQNLA